MNDQGLKYLSGAIVFVVVTLAFMFRYEYNEHKDRRVSRFTGDIPVSYTHLTLPTIYSV